MRGPMDCIFVDRVIGHPISALTSAAASLSRAASSALSFRRTVMRSSSDIRGQGPLSNASRAAVTAASMSASTPSGTRATSCSVAGEITSKVRSDAGCTHCPPMNSVSYCPCHSSVCALIVPLLRIRFVIDVVRVSGGSHLSSLDGGLRLDM